MPSISKLAGTPLALTTALFLPKTMAAAIRDVEEFCDFDLQLETNSASPVLAAKQDIDQSFLDITFGPGSMNHSEKEVGSTFPPPPAAEAAPPSHDCRELKSGAYTCTSLPSLKKTSLPNSY